MNIFKDEDESFKKIKEEMSNSKRMISKLDVADAIRSAVTSAISAMVFSHNVHCANVIAALDAKNSLDNLFPEESHEKEKCEEAPDVEFEKKYDDLKCRLFTHAANGFLSLQVKIKDQRIAERRSAKYTELLLLISEAGLINEYYEWLRENGYNS